MPLNVTRIRIVTSCFVVHVLIVACATIGVGIPWYGDSVVNLHSDKLSSEKPASSPSRCEPSRRRSSIGHSHSYVFADLWPSLVPIGRSSTNRFMARSVSSLT